ncbi:acyltransferase domain-containing protein [Agrobacterium vitis]|uniref:type I polyketide synthase n=1 Tax=Rhizobium/Agrobacterium group TaxID=227290 RepID=UPI0012E763D2|nr:MULTISPECIES: type I polyketide synthase [Rhizobium/Agrobacterium group]MCF1495771.1 acyltransferase domain-containing protein [Allorhizobium ampelinum]MVA45794.1 acyltransferase domain-containing protein [Agrobacterium vitis]
MPNADATRLAAEGTDQAAMLAALRGARKRIEELQRERHERVAIVGMAGRFPGADDIDAFWRLLDAGATGLRQVSDEELREAGIGAEEAARPDYVRAWGGFNDPTGFDAEFFGYSPRDAELLDPQQRVFLECSWNALEHAGYDSRAYDGRIGVYAGGSLNYYFSNIQANAALRNATDPLHAGLSNVAGMIASRVAYHLDLRGPSVGVQATCATSLVAVHLATQALLARETDMAIAGAAAIVLPKPVGYIHQSEGVASPDGQCRPFDAAAHGTVFTNGVGVLILKRLSDAEADGDTIYAVIRGSAIGNDGSAKVGVTAPSVTGQTAVLEAALATSGIDPASIDYVEAHGTGTALGDPIEVEALNRVYGPAFAKTGRDCGLGSVKGNIGHMDAAAGMAGLIKMVLAMRHGRIPASINFDRPNPRCDFSAGPFRVLSEGRNWPAADSQPRRAAISAFGMGGANAHLIIEEGPVPAVSGMQDEAVLLPLSARTPEALEAMRLALAASLSSDDAPALDDIAHTLQLGRRPMTYRSLVMAHDRSAAADILAGAKGPDPDFTISLSNDPSLVFMFPGQGVQHPGMARDLYERESAFRTALDQCLELTPNELDLRSLLLAPGPGSAEALNRTEATQPALFAFEYALARMWLRRGLQPRALIGHSVGEYVAACLAGVFSLEDALRVVCARGRLMQACEPGAMLSVMLSQLEAESVLSPDVDLAAVNGPRSCVLAGRTEAIAALAAQFDRSGLGSRLLKTSHAFHSFMMEPALAEFTEVLVGVSLKPPSIDIVSNVTGDWLTDTQATDGAYWVQHVRKPVLFGPGLERLMAVNNPILLEVGPGSTLTRLARQHSQEGARAIASMPNAGSESNAADRALLAFGELWAAGLDVDWRKLRPPKHARRVGLPGYRFQHQSYWIGPTASTAPVDPGTDDAGRLPDLKDWFSQPIWTRRPQSLAPESAAPVRWLLLNGAAVMTAIGALPQNVEAIFVEAGETFAAQEGAYTVDPGDVQSYRALFSDLAASDAIPDQIVNGFAFAANSQDDVALSTTLTLGRALAGESRMPRLLTVIGEGMHRITGAEALDPGGSMVRGCLRALSQELSGLDCRSLDLSDATGEVGGLRAFLATPFDEAACVAALRDGFVWIEGHEATPLAEPEMVPVLREGETYLVLGELLDGLGVAYTRAVVHALRGRVILVGRSGLPQPSQWEGWLGSHSPEHSVSRLIRSLRELGTPGKDYLLFSGDLQDSAWLAQVFAEGQEQLGPIRGIFHGFAMGDSYHCPLAELEAERLDAPFIAKVNGLCALDEALSGLSPDFVLVQSSLSTLVGGSGLCAYAAANAFLDAFVEAQRGSRKPIWQTINWDNCRPYDAMPDAAGGFYAGAIDPDEVWRVSRTLLAHPAISRAIVSPYRLADRMAAAKRGETQPATPVVDQKAGRGRSTANYAAPRDEIEKAVAGVMSELLGVEMVGGNDNFFELGGHSLLAVQVVTRLRKQLDIELPMRALLFEAPTVGGIAAVIRETMLAAERERLEVATLLDNIEFAAEPAGDQKF